MRRETFALLPLAAGLILAVALVVGLEGAGLAAAPEPGGAQAAPVPVLDPLPPASLQSTSAVSLFPNCRFGLDVWPGQLSEFDIVSELGVGWYLTFNGSSPPPGPPEAEYARLVHVSQDRGGSDVCGPEYGYATHPALDEGELGAQVDSSPGALWIVGNEPDRIRQDDVCPQQYAQAYHDVYHFIKGRDPTAQVAIAGLVEVTPGRLQYLDIVWDTYLQRYGTEMPVDVWTMHVYVLSETNDGDAHIALGTDPALAIPFSFNCEDPDSYCHAEHDDMDLFIEQVLLMRGWMQQHGQQDRPLLITEYGLLKPYHYYGFCASETCPPPEGEGCFCDENNETFHPRRVADYMEATFDYLLTAADPALGYPEDGYRLVQQWFWFSLASDPPLAGHASNLVDPYAAYTLTVPGWRWQGYVSTIAPTSNLLPRRVPAVVARAPDGTSPVTVSLSAVVVNSGNTTPFRPVTVTFYSDAALTTPIAATTFTGLGGCAWRERVVTVTWPSLATGRYFFWVQVDSSDVVTESDESDNVALGVVLVNPQQLYLPLALRG